MAQAGHGSFQRLAAELVELALPVTAQFTSLRACAFTLIGLDEYRRRCGGDRRGEPEAYHATSDMFWVTAG